MPDKDGNQTAAERQREAEIKFRVSVGTFIESQTELNKTVTSFFLNHLPHLQADVAVLKARVTMLTAAIGFAGTVIAGVLIKLLVV